jgi:hypothetical protein
LQDIFIACVDGLKGFPPLALALSTSARCREPSIAPGRASSPPVSADLAGCCRRNPWGASSVLCKRPSFSFHDVPDRLDGPERRVGLCGDATRAPTQGPGFRVGERSSPLGPGILAQSEKSRGFGGRAPIPETLLFRFFHRRPASPARRPVGDPRIESRSVVRRPSNPGPAWSSFWRCAPIPCTATSSLPPRSGTSLES